jgi:hypothetical protein
MKRQLDRLLVWTVLGAFLSFSICLPFGHICLNQISDNSQQAALRTIHAQPHEVEQGHQDDFCQACQLGQTLILDKSVAELKAIRTVTSTLGRLYAPIIALSDSFQSTSKRAPPAGR